MKNDTKHNHALLFVEVRKNNRFKRIKKLLET